MKRVALYGGAAVLGCVVLYFAVKKAQGLGSDLAAAAETVGGWVNPTADTNLAYRGVNAVGAALTSDPSFSLGSYAYDVHEATGVSPWQMINPANAAGTAIGGYLTGVWNSATARTAARADQDAVAELSQFDAMGNYMGYGQVNYGGASGSW